MKLSDFIAKMLGLVSIMILKYPAMFLISLLTSLELMTYFSLRYIIYALESFRFCRSNSKLRRKVRFGIGVKSYSEWREHAKLLDQIDKREEWKQKTVDPIYNHKIIQKLVFELHTTRTRIKDLIIHRSKLLKRFPDLTNLVNPTQQQQQQQQSEVTGLSVAIQPPLHHHNSADSSNILLSNPAKEGTSPFATIQQGNSNLFTASVTKPSLNFPNYSNHTKFISTTIPLAPTEPSSVPFPTNPLSSQPQLPLLQPTQSSMAHHSPQPTHKQRPSSHSTPPQTGDLSASQHYPGVDELDIALEAIPVELDPKSVSMDPVDALPSIPNNPSFARYTNQIHPDIADIVAGIIQDDNKDDICEVNSLDLSKSEDESDIEHCDLLDKNAISPNDLDSATHSSKSITNKASVRIAFKRSAQTSAIADLCAPKTRQNSQNSSPISPSLDAHEIDSLLTFPDALKQFQDYEQEINTLLFSLIHIIQLALRQQNALLNEELYSYTNVGSKYLVSTLTSELIQSLQVISDSPQPPEQRLELFLSLSKLYGHNALCLSGGAGFCSFHWGLVKALVDENMLSTIKCFSGTSAGSLVAAHLCTRTDEELQLHGFDPTVLSENMKFDNGEGTWDKLKSLYNHGFMIDSGKWTDLLRFHCCGDMTFLEAYQRTGRVLVITATPAGNNEPPIFFSYLTSPHLVIRTACVASATIPFLLPPASLLFKDPTTGELKPDTTVYSGLKDGSFLADIPNLELAYYFNTSFHLVSQVNPHISLFYFNRTGKSGRSQTHWGWSEFRGTFLLSFLESWLKYDMVKNLQIMKEMRLFPHFTGVGDISNIFLQNFSGPTHNSICLVPDTSFRDYLALLSAPTPDDLTRMMQAGRMMLYFSKSLIDSRLSVSNQILLSIQRAELEMGKQIPLKNQFQGNPGSIPNNNNPHHNDHSSPSSIQYQPRHTDRSKRTTFVNTPTITSTASTPSGCESK